MNNSNNPHIALLESASAALRPLPWEFIYIGGATISLYLDDPAARDIRITTDVDCVVSVSTYAAFAAVEEALRREGFTQIVSDESPICRWCRNGLVLDIMPVEPKLLGFGESRWFQKGFENARIVALPSNAEIKVFDVAYLLATKIEAYCDRADNDYLMSKDFEDIATILDGRVSIFKELSRPGEVCKFILNWFNQYSPDEFEEMLGSHICDYGRGEWIVERLAEIP